MSTKASYDLAGGYVEFDMDVSGAHGGVNNNVYATFPPNINQYCDSGGTGGCAEYDWTENNGNCAQATTWHHNRGGNDKGGQQYVGGLSSHVHVKVTWSGDGKQSTVAVGGNTHSDEGFADVMAQHGLVMYSSQWTGWVPGHCGGDGNLGASRFSVSNLKLKGRIVQGPEPTKCGALTSNITIV